MSRRTMCRRVVRDGGGAFGRGTLGERDGRGDFERCNRRLDLPSFLAFTPANWEEPQTLTVIGVDDDLLDGDIAYSLQLAAVEHEH